MAVVAVGGDALVAFFGAGLKADNDRFLSDIEVAETANQAHAVKLACLFLEPADQQHLAVKFQEFLFRGVGFTRCSSRFAAIDVFLPRFRRDSSALNYLLHDDIRECTGNRRKAALQNLQCFMPAEGAMVLAVRIEDWVAKCLSEEAVDLYPKRQHLVIWPLASGSRLI